MALYFIRHGQTHYNAAKRFQGRKDIPLNSAGKEQATLLRNLLESHQISLKRLVSSPLSRAVETAKIISSGNIEILIEPDFTEIDLGSYDGCLESELADSVGEKEYSEWRASQFMIAAPGGESMEDVRKRVGSALKESCILAKDSHLGIVAHQGVLMAMKSVLSNCKSTAKLQDYKQANDEIDIWDVSKSTRIGTLQLAN